MYPLDSVINLVKVMDFTVIVLVSLGKYLYNPLLLK
jgi:hypothetical protein